ncbi:hypothetical protein E2N92_04530 [Methanofollis formosanus]|uniref:Uncharacterized protein n=1 Tax=Methanofollis formosanus TaxID=299308 RepID=A0A8G1A1K4_9EURY|nr:hypothetical protein [Methanofollis formosanus]QYZ78746.1 hypothetical protein E2N92_04530 [Methanofollis formosanus]
MESKSGFLLIAVCLCIALMAAPASAATTSVTITKYADNNYSAVDQTESLTWQEMRTNLSNKYSNGPVYMQGPTFNSNDPWGDSGQNMIWFCDHNGTAVSDLVDKVGGMSSGDEVMIQSDDNFAVYFGYDNVYTPHSRQGEMILTWWDGDYSYVPNFRWGMRLYFYTPPDSYGVADSLNLTLRDMEAAFDPWYRHNYTDSSGSWPSAKGLSAKYVDRIKVYPPHRYDFATGGDTVEYAYKGGVNATPSTRNMPNTPFTSANIDADDGDVYWFNTSTNGNYAAQRFVFNVTESASNIEKLNVTWDGTGSHDNTSADQGATTYIWKSGTGYETLSGDITSNIGDYVVNGNVTVFVKQNTAQFYDENDCEDKLSHIATDYVKLVVTHHHTN